MKTVFCSTIVLILVACSCLSCNRLPDTYQFKNRDRIIISVELMCNPNASDGYTGQAFELIRKLEQHEIETFMTSLYALETKLGITPPVRGFGPNIVCVTYENGDMEYFASWHIEFVEKGKNPTGVGSYYFRGNCFDELFLEYSGGQGQGQEGQGDGSVVP